MSTRPTNLADARLEIPPHRLHVYENGAVMRKISRYEWATLLIAALGCGAVWYSNIAAPTDAVLMNGTPSLSVAVSSDGSNVVVGENNNVTTSISISDQ